MWELGKWSMVELEGLELDGTGPSRKEQSTYASIFARKWVVLRRERLEVRAGAGGCWMGWVKPKKATDVCLHFRERMGCATKEAIGGEGRCWSDRDQVDESELSMPPFPRGFGLRYEGSDPRLGFGGGQGNQPD